MRIIGYEIRKLLNWRVLGLVLLISLLFYNLFLSFHFDYFPNGRPALDHYNVSKQMIEKYGPEMDETEFLDFEQTYKEEVEKAENYLQSRDDFVEVGVTTYEQFRNFDSSNEKIDNLHSDVMFEKGVDVFWELQARESIIEYYERRKDSVLSNATGIDNEDWKQKVVEGTSINAILPYLVLENYNTLITMLSILIVLSVMVIVGRVCVVDQKNNAIILQYTTNIGRDLFKKKIVASIITATLVTSFYMGVFFLMYAQNETGAFFKSSIHSFQSIGLFWLDLTFLQYIVLTVVGVYLLALTAAAITTFISRMVVNYISLIGLQVPVAVMLVLLMLAYLISGLFSVNYPLFVTIGTYVGLLILGITLLTFRYRKEQRIDII